VTALCWVPKGKCNAQPVKAADDEDAHDLMDDGVGHGAGEAAGSTEGLEDFELDQYDDEEDAGMNFFSVLNSDGELAKEVDPFMTGNPDSDSESEDYYGIRPDDNIFMAVSCEEENCMLEMYIYDADEATMYVHHDIMLDAYPLCVEWLSSASGAGTGSFAAVGLIDHQVQIWNLDHLDPLHPAQCLGVSQKEALSKSAASLKKKKKGKKATRGGTKAHDGAVLCLHGSLFNRSILATGSADQTVKVWDVSENATVHTYDHHTDKVQVVKWHPTEQAVFLSAAFDRHLALLDARQPGQAAFAKLPAEAECSIWSRHQPFECLSSVDDGHVVCHDVRKVAGQAAEKVEPLWTLRAHDVACTAIQDTPTPEMLLTASLDGVAKIWRVSGSGPSVVHGKDLQAGPLFACQSSAEEPALVSFGGSCPVMWNVADEECLEGIFNFPKL